MTTLGQVLANQENARLSTGPKTDEGKTASARNAFKHGMESKRLLPDEDAAEFERFRQALLEERDPQSRPERQLVEELVMLYWKQARLERLEMEFWTRGLQPGPDGRVSETPLVDMLCSHGREFSSFLRYSSQLSRALERTQKELRELQEQRRLLTLRAAAVARQRHGAGAVGATGTMGAMDLASAMAPVGHGTGPMDAAVAAGNAAGTAGAMQSDAEADGPMAMAESKASGAQAATNKPPAPRAASGGNGNGNGNAGGLGHGNGNGNAGSTGQKPRPPAARHSQFIPGGRR